MLKPLMGGLVAPARRPYFAYTQPVYASSQRTTCALRSGRQECSPALGIDSNNNVLDGFVMLIDIEATPVI